MHGPAPARTADLAQRARQSAAHGQQVFEAYVRARPVQAALYAAALGAVAAELLLRALRRSRSR